MTVRRYSTNCSLAGVSERERGPDRARRRTTSSWGRLQEEIRLQDDRYSSSAAGQEDVVPRGRSLQEYVHKNRFARIKIKMRSRGSESFLSPLMFLGCFVLQGQGEDGHLPSPRG